MSDLGNALVDYYAKMLFGIIIGVLLFGIGTGVIAVKAYDWIHHHKMHIEAN